MTELEKLRGFAQDVMAGWPADDGIGACELQETATKWELLEPRMMDEPCGEDCSCRDCDADFPTECFRKTPLLTGVK